MRQSSLAGYQAYQKSKYETASPHKLILMLYDGAIRFAEKAIEEIEAKNIAESHQWLIKAQDVVYELISSLNEQEGGEMAQNLKRLYLYIIEQIVQANLKKEAAPVQEALHILRELRSAWEQIGKEVSIAKASIRSV